MTFERLGAGILVLLVCLENVGMAMAKTALEAIPDHINGAGLGKK